MHHCRRDLSGRIAKFNISLARAGLLQDMLGSRNPAPASAATIENPQETEMRLKLLSPGEMNPEQKSTYDESIASKRGRPPPPMMAWLNSPDPGDRAALDLALRMVRP
jgi:hypothetical protein